ncbi:hypothetical protein G6F57_016722 [Rhizopus arrhizus]|nr:hypothetical protein G6F57_016722 [Rhizopus arrhizus]
MSPNQVCVDITDTESRLIGALIQAAPLPLSRGRLVEALGASADAYDTHRLDAHMHRLRRKLRAQAGGDMGIRTVPDTPLMTLPIRPRRSVLYMPGANARALDKARSLDADALILDLEDAVAPDAKAAAREQVARALREGGYGRRECIVRINALDTPWGQDDVDAIAQAGAHAVLLPKVQSAGQLAALAQALDAAGAPPDLPLWAMAETPLGFLRLDAIAGGHPRLAAIVVGTSDLVKDLHARHTPTREETLLARSMAVMAAHCRRE